MWFEAFVLGVALVAASIASVTGFGIGSLLTPTIGLLVPTDVAVAALYIPHLVAAALRFSQLRSSVDRRVLLSFGVTSAAGGLTWRVSPKPAFDPSSRSFSACWD